MVIVNVDVVTSVVVVAASATSVAAVFFFGILADAVDSSLGGMLEVIPQGDETEALFGISGV